MFDICLLGTGGMMPLPNRWLTSLLVRYNGRMILIDCGEGTQIPLKMAEWGFKPIDAILFTHYHADHVAGLPGLLLSLGNAGREEPLVIMGPPGIKRVVEGMTVISPELPYDLHLIELPAKTQSENVLGDVYIKSIPVDHNIPCLAYSLELKRQGKFDVEKARAFNVPMNQWNKLQKGESVTVEDRIITSDMVLGESRKGIKISYCTDSRPTSELPEFIKDSDLFICEGMYGDEENREKAVQKRHMMFGEAAQLAKEGNVKELWLTHYSPSLNDPDEFIENARGIFESTVAGKDLLKKTIRYED